MIWLLGLLLLLGVAAPAQAVTLTENWNCSFPAASLTCQQTWSEPTGGNWGIVTPGVAQFFGNVSGNTARLEANTTTANQVVTGLVSYLQVAGVVAMSVSCRYSASAETYYHFQAENISGTAGFRIERTVAGADTTIATSTQDPVNGDLMELSCIGSTITGKVNGIVLMRVTDTTIDGVTVGGKRAGIRGYSSDAGNGAAIDDFSVSDAPAQSFTEDWNCSNAAVLPCDLPWTESTGGNWTITGNQAQVTGNVADNSAKAGVNTATPDQAVQATLKTFTQAGTNLGVSVMCRYHETDETYYELQATNGSGILFWDLSYSVAGVYNAIDAHAQDPTVNDVFILKCIGTTISVVVNGVTLISVTNTAINGTTTGGTRAGIRGYSDNAGSTVALDDWSVQDAVAAVGGSGRGLLLGVGP